MTATRILIIELDDAVLPPPFEHPFRITTRSEETFEAKMIYPDTDPYRLVLRGDEIDSNLLLARLDEYRYLLSITSLRIQLDINRCYLTDERLHQFLTRLQTDKWAPQIKRIDINNNRISLTGFRELLAFIADHCPNCEHLESGDNHVTSAELQTLPQPPHLDSWWNGGTRIRPTNPPI